MDPRRRRRLDAVPPPLLGHYEHVTRPRGVSATVLIPSGPHHHPDESATPREEETCGPSERLSTWVGAEARERGRAYVSSDTLHRRPTEVDHEAVARAAEAAGHNGRTSAKLLLRSMGDGSLLLSRGDTGTWTTSDLAEVVRARLSGVESNPDDETTKERTLHTVEASLLELRGVIGDLVSLRTTMPKTRLEETIREGPVGTALAIKALVRPLTGLAQLTGGLSTLRWRLEGLVSCPPASQHLEVVTLEGGDEMERGTTRQDASRPSYTFPTHFSRTSSPSSTTDVTEIRHSVRDLQQFLQQVGDLRAQLDVVLSSSETQPHAVAQRPSMGALVVAAEENERRRERGEAEVEKEAEVTPHWTETDGMSVASLWQKVQAVEAERDEFCSAMKEQESLVAYLKEILAQRDVTNDTLQEEIDFQRRFATKLEEECTCLQERLEQANNDNLSWQAKRSQEMEDEWGQRVAGAESARDHLQRSVEAMQAELTTREKEGTEERLALVHRVSVLEEEKKRLEEEALCLSQNSQTREREEGEARRRDQDAYAREIALLRNEGEEKARGFRVAVEFMQRKLHETQKELENERATCARVVTENEDLSRRCAASQGETKTLERAVGAVQTAMDALRVSWAQQTNSVLEAMRDDEEEEDAREEDVEDRTGRLRSPANADRKDMDQDDAVRKLMIEFLVQRRVRRRGDSILPPNFHEEGDGTFQFGTIRIRPHVQDGRLHVRVNEETLLFDDFLERYGRTECLRMQMQGVHVSTLIRTFEPTHTKSSS